MTKMFVDAELTGDIWNLVCFSTWFIEFLEGVLREAILAASESAASVNGMFLLVDDGASSETSYAQGRSRTP